MVSLRVVWRVLFSVHWTTTEIWELVPYFELMSHKLKVWNLSKENQRAIIMGIR